MTDAYPLPTAELGVAALGGFLEGISYLNHDRRADFAASFVLNGVEAVSVTTAIRAVFAQLPDLDLRVDVTFDGSLRQLEQELPGFLLIAPNMEDEDNARDLRPILAFKIMDRLDDIFGMGNIPNPTKLIGTSSKTAGSMVFYVFQSPKLCCALYFHRTTGAAPNA